MQRTEDEILLLEALGKIEALQPCALVYIRENGYIFDGDLKDPRNEIERWQKLAFSLYSDLCEASNIARMVRGECEGDTP